MVSVKDRIILFIDHIGISKSKFEVEIGVSNGYLTKLRHKPSDKVISGILKRFPEINKVWLLSGEGSMMASPKSETKEYDVLIKLIEEYRDQIRIKDEQISKLLNLIK